jgi:apolipoprotein N-acyltransferase
VSADRRDLVLAATSGLALGVAFLPLPLAPLAWVALVPLLAALQRRVAAGAGALGAFRLGYVGGFAFFLTGMHWIALLSDVASTVHWIKYVAWLLAGGYLALFWGLAAWLAYVLARRSGVRVQWAFVPAMLLVEELRGSGELGFPWFQPGYTQQALPIMGMAALGSVTLVTAWVLAVNAAVLGLWRRRTASTFAVLVALLALPYVHAGIAARLAAGRAPAGAPAPMVALVQGDIPGEIKWSGKHEPEILATFLALSDTALTRRGPAGQRPSLLVWPETATGSYLRKQLEQSIPLAEFVNSRGVPVFTGFADYEYGADGKPRAWNAAGTWAPGGVLSEVYAKRHLVPFGERMPFQSLVPALGKIDFGQAEWEPGRRTVLFPSAAGPFACLVCFESIFPSLARADVRRGARMLVVVTNDEWFGNSAALYQHAAMAPFRAVENGVPLLRCANTGLTEIIAPNGRVVARAPAWTACVLAGEVPAATGPTPYTRWGDWPGALAGISVLALALRRWRREAQPG